VFTFTTNRYNELTTDRTEIRREPLINVHNQLLSRGRFKLFGASPLFVEDPGSGT